MPKNEIYLQKRMHFGSGKKSIAVYGLAMQCDGLDCEGKVIESC